MSQHHYEGPDLTALLERVSRELGPDATIVSAQKVRTGGVGGFFARERFEVTAEPGASKANTAAAPSASPTGAATTNGVNAAAANAPRDILELAELRNEEDVWEPSPKISTESSTFAEVLARVNEVVGASTGSTPASDTDDDDTDDTITALADVPDLPEREEPLPPAARTIAPVIIANATPTPAVTHMSRGRRSADVAGLESLGVPSDLLPAAGARDLRSELVVRLQRLPAPMPLPNERGTVIAVVGACERAQASAERLAATLGLDTDDIVIASELDIDRPEWCRIADATSAATRRRSWWRRDRATVVVVDSVSADREWAVDMLAALEPSLAVGVVDARSKAEDVAAWCSELAIDTIELEDTAATVSPAAVLQIGIPISHVDGVEASAHTWADLLLGRVSA